MENVQINEELSSSPTVLLLMPGTDYNEVIVNTIKDLAKKPVCYVTLNKTHDSLRELFKKNKVNVDNIVFIDAISKTFKPVSNADNCTFVSSPGALTELSIAVTNNLDRNFDCFIFDSLTNLMIYEKKAPVAKFVSTLVNKFRAKNVKAVFYALSVKEQSALIEETGIFVDKVIDLSK
ncbi:hypothetical protein ACFLZ6_02055 [Nanoarchaeota archaeon]